MPKKNQKKVAPISTSTQAVTSVVTPQFTHKCIKITCPNTYLSVEPDAYYCPSCKEESVRLAKLINEKMSKNPRREVKSDLQIYNEASKRRGSPFISARDLGL